MVKELAVCPTCEAEQERSVQWKQEMSHFAGEDLLWTRHMRKLGTFLVPPRAVLEESIFKT